jgi:hypothetical protein
MTPDPAVLAVRRLPNRGHYRRLPRVTFRCPVCGLVLVRTMSAWAHARLAHDMWEGL